MNRILYDTTNLTNWNTCSAMLKMASKKSENEEKNKMTAMP